MAREGSDPFDLARFVVAQDPVYDRVCAELRAGRKTTHWIWFIFPQLAGLGQSQRGRYYGIGSMAEARAYHGHALLNARLAECCTLLCAHHGTPLIDIVGDIDAKKVISSMTLFARAAPEALSYRAVLDAFNGGQHDAATLEMISESTQ